MESPNQYLSPEPFFARIAPTSFEIQGSKVCSTIRPLPLRHCFGWFQGNHVWKAPTSTFHQNLFLPGLLQPVSRSKGPKCARLSAPSLCATVLVGFKGTMYGKPQPVPFTRTFFCQDCSNQFRDPRVQSVLDYPPPPSAPLFWLVSKEPCMESPNQYLSPEPFFARIAPTSFEIQGSKVCSTIRPLPQAQQAQAGQFMVPFMAIHGGVEKHRWARGVVGAHYSTGGGGGGGDGARGYCAHCCRRAAKAAREAALTTACR